MKFNKYKLFKKIGLALLLVPISFLLFFGVGEMIGKTPGAYIHFLQVLPLIIFFFFAVFDSDWVGYLLLIVGTILGLLFLANFHNQLSTLIIVELMFFVMPVISGIFLLLSKNK
jgi:hypothetical protein